MEIIVVILLLKYPTLLNTKFTSLLTAVKIIALKCFHLRTKILSNTFIDRDEMMATVVLGYGCL